MAGKSADNIGNQSGGWTISLAGRQRRDHAGHDDPAGHPQHGRAVDHGHLQRRPGPASTAPTSAAIAVVGETPYAEGDGDRPGGDGPGHAPTCNAINTLRAAGVPVVVVLVSGRPLDIAVAAGQLERAASRPGCPAPRARAWPTCCSAWPTPTGKLPVTWMYSAEPAADQRRRRQDAAVPVRVRARLRRAADRAARYAMTQAEAYNAQSGTQLETTTDTGGGQNVGWIAPGRLAGLRRRRLRRRRRRRR